MENELILRTNEQHEKTAAPTAENNSGPEEIVETSADEVSEEIAGE